MSQKIITVFGATGNQGGSVINALLAHPTLSKTYAIRAVTRNPSKLASQKLISRGCTVVQADLADPASLAAALQGAHAVFSVTNFWELMSFEKEVAQGKAVANACVKAGVQHLVWSSLPAAKRISGGAIANAEHFDSKAVVEEYIEGVKGSMWATYVMPAFFMLSLQSMVKEREAGLMYAVPLDAEKTRQPLIDVQEDYGKWVAGVLEAGQKADGLHVNAVTEWLSPGEIVRTSSRVSGKKIGFEGVSVEEFAGFFPGKSFSDEMVDTALLIRDFSYYGPGQEEVQAQSDGFLAGYSKSSLAGWVEKAKPWA